MADYHFTEKAERDLEAIIDFTLRLLEGTEILNKIDRLEAILEGRL